MPRLTVTLALLIAAPFVLAAQPDPVKPSPVASPLVIGESFTIASKVLGETRRINVYHPHVYTETISGPLPVLYMPDGGLSEDFLHVAGLLQSQIDGGLMRPFLLVGIENTVRRRDLTGPTQDPEDRKIAPVIGGAKVFRQFIADELMPEVQARYPVTAERAIVGESLAGLFIVDTLFEMPSLFDTYIALDPSLWWNQQARAKTQPAQLAGLKTALKGKTLFLASSNEKGIAEPTAQLAARLQADVQGMRVLYLPMPQETHGTLYHPGALAAFRAVFAPEPAPAH